MLRSGQSVSVGQVCSLDKGRFKPDGSWQAFMANKFPEQLYDEIKKHHGGFYMAPAHLTP
eukprot:12880001-Prorocentrum_lima.AAC.1